jgi:uncharacterized repeat protein (TIGR01451 family)
MMIVGPRADAQQYSLSVTPSANSIMVSNSLIYTINVTNLGSSLIDTFVTNVLSTSFQPNSVTYSQGTYSISSNVVLFELGTFSAGQVAQLTVTAIPTAVGFISNAVTVAYPAGTTNTAFTNVVVQVTNLVIQADLGVTIIGPKQAVITNDWMTYGVTVSNAGPNAASSVMLTNTLPLGVIAISPTNQTGSSNMIFNLGTLTNGSYTNLQFTVEPTNAGALLFSASVGATGITDPNTTNNVASSNITVMVYPPALLYASTNSAQAYNPQNGLVEQSITVTNAGTNAVTAVRVVVTGLANRLFNAVGTNSGNPFVVYSAALNTNQIVNLLLQYSASAYFAFTNGQLHAFAVPVPNWTPPPVTATSTNINISRIVELSNGDMLIEFPSTLGRTYTVVYSTNVSFSGAMIAPPSIVAPANRTQWIDYGPPTTVSAPTDTSVRFYRVYQNP